jgi:hypothetical protein
MAAMERQCQHRDATSSELLCECPVYLNSVLPLLLLHTRAVSSPDAVAILLPSGDHATEPTQHLCPVSINSMLPLLLFHTRTELLSYVVAILLPSGDQATE